MRNMKKHLDSAEEFKQRSLNAIERRKRVAKITYRILIIVAVLMMFAVIAAYFLDY